LFAIALRKVFTAALRLWMQVCPSIPSVSLIRVEPGSPSLCFEACRLRMGRTASFLDRRKQEEVPASTTALGSSFWVPTLSLFLLLKDVRASNRKTASPSSILPEISSQNHRSSSMVSVSRKG